MKIGIFIKEEDGFAFSATSFLIAIILGLFIVYFSNTTSLGTVKTGNKFANSQANWSAVAGIETAIAFMTSGLTNFAGTYNLGNSTITLDTLTIDPVNKIMRITSTGTYMNSIKILEINFEIAGGDTFMTEGFDSDDSFEYDPPGGGPGSGRYWGMTCGDDAESDFLPLYVLTGAEGCYFFGTKIQANSELEIDEVEVDESGNYILTLSLAAGVDVPDPWAQSEFQTGDYLEVYANGTIVERWEGNSAGGGQPMVPLLGAASMELTPVFTEYSLDITSAIGETDEIEISFEAKTNTNIKYIGIDGLTLYATAGYSTVHGSYKRQ